MFRILREYRLAFMLYGSFLLTGLLLIASMPKVELHSWMNSQHVPFLDWLFRFLTLLGDGWFAAGISVILLMVKFRYALMTAASALVSGILVQVLKRVVFSGMDRPASFLELMPGLDLVSGVDLHHHLSFPSGHATTAFAVLVIAGLISPRKWHANLIMLLACLAGFSRVYLSQHFLVDVMAGSLIGLFSALLFYWYFKGLNWNWLRNH
jgi:membrane-associated phospholipid phosphatase